MVSFTFCTHTDLSVFTDKKGKTNKKINPLIIVLTWKGSEIGTKKAGGWRGVLFNH